MAVTVARKIIAAATATEKEYKGGGNAMVYNRYERRAVIHMIQYHVYFFPLYENTASTLSSSATSSTNSTNRRRNNNSSN